MHCPLPTAHCIGKLSLDEQVVIRIAAVVGMTFRSDALDRAIMAPMRPYLSTILSSLVGGFWLTCHTVRQPNGMRFFYSFRHHTIQMTLYDTTPQKFRGSVHLTIAEHLEKNIFESLAATNAHGQGHGYRASPVHATAAAMMDGTNRG